MSSGNLKKKTQTMCDLKVPSRFTLIVYNLMFIVFLCLSGQRDEEELRRRVASITYSDPLYWDQPAAAGENRFH